jgi:DNA-binding NtrC family response regulator
MARTLEILVVEDDGAMVKLIEAVFKATPIGDYLVRRASSLAEGIKAATGMTPDLVLLDLDLPDAKQLEGVKSMVALAPKAAIVVLTSNTDIVLATEAIRLGAQDWLFKGLDIKRLLPTAVIFAVERQRHRIRLMAEIEGLRSG